MKPFKTIGQADRIERFCHALIGATSQREAYHKAFPKSRKWPDATVDSKASQLWNKPQTQDRYRQVLASIPVEKLLNPAEHAKRLLDRGQKAFDEKNYTASAAYDRIIASANGMAKDSSVTVNWNMSDTDLARRLAGDDPEKLAAAASLLGKSSFESDTKGPDRSDNETKH